MADGTIVGELYWYKSNDKRNKVGQIIIRTITLIKLRYPLLQHEVFLDALILAVTGKLGKGGGC